MQITITATLTDEQALILAKRMWYSEEVSSPIYDENMNPISYELIKNPQSTWEFIKEVYEKMLINDVIKHFIAYNNEKNKAIWDAEDQAIKEEVISSVTSKVL